MPSVGSGNHPAGSSKTPSKNRPGKRIRAGVPTVGTGPDLAFSGVGVAGFEPTTSSSRMASRSSLGGSSGEYGLVSTQVRIGLLKAGPGVLHKIVSQISPGQVIGLCLLVLGFPVARCNCLRCAIGELPAGLPGASRSRAGSPWPPEAGSRS
jgi:hypothetical protein